MVVLDLLVKILRWVKTLVSHCRWTKARIIWMRANGALRNSRNGAAKETPWSENRAMILVRRRIRPTTYSTKAPFGPFKSFVQSHLFTYHSTYASCNKLFQAKHPAFFVANETLRCKHTGLRWRSEAKPFEKQARDEARWSEAKSSVGEELGALVGT